MGENYKSEYSETGWADDFLAEVLSQLPQDVNPGQFRGMLDKYSIQKDEAHGFLDAYKNGEESLKEFLNKRVGAKPEERESIKFPEPEEGIQKPQKKAA